MLNAQLAVYAQLTCLKMGYKRIHFKKYYFVEQSLYKLETEEAKMGSNLAAMEIADILGVESPVFKVY